MSMPAHRPLISVMGDSISTFQGCNPEGFDVFYEGSRCSATGVERPEDTWWRHVIGHFDGELLVNGSFSGSMVQGEGFPAASSPERIAALSCDGRSPDAVIVFIGINDYGWGSARAQAHAGAHAAPECSRVSEQEREEAALAPLDAAETFRYSYGRMLAGLRRAYPIASIWCCTLCPGRLGQAPAPTFVRSLRGASFASYNEAIRSSALEHGCRVVDFESFGLDYEAVDGTHPSRRGMRQLAAMAITSMETQGAFGGIGKSEAAEKMFEEAFSACDMRSGAICGEAHCIGCRFARGTGNAWSLVCEKQLA